MKEQKRQANFELLRILAMLMVVTMHYLIKGNVAVSMAQDGSGMNLLAWFLESVCIVAVNVYVLISGYFLSQGNWSIKKLVKLYLQIWFYSVSVPLVCLVLGVGDVSLWSIYDWANVIFPLQTEHYWFATAYIVMYLMVPVLSAAVERMSKKQLEITMILLVSFFSLGKSVIPILLPTDSYGYDFGWFLCLFLISAYIRRYGIKIFERERNCFIGYFVFVFLIFVCSAGLGWLSREKGMPLSYAMDMVHCYNHILVLLASVALFYGFLHLKIPEGRLADLICKAAPYTFGVYLLHENRAIRLLWQGWFGIEKVRGKILFIPHMIFTVVVIFLVGILMDFVREYWFQKIGKAMNRRKENR